MKQLLCAFAPAGLELDGRKLSGVALAYGKIGYPTDGVPTIIRAGAFGTIGDVLLNVQHDAGRVIARTTGGTMTLTDGTDQLSFAAELPDTREAKDAVKLIAAGVLACLSIEAVPIVAPMVKGIRTVEKATLTGLAIVARPGFRETSVKVAAEQGAYGKPVEAPWWLA